MTRLFLNKIKWIKNRIKQSKKSDPSKWLKDSLMESLTIQNEIRFESE